MHIVLALLIFTLLTFSPNIAFSDGQVSGDTKTKVIAEEIAFEEVPVVVTASRKPQKITEALSTIDVITAEDIKDWGVLTLDEALEFLPGMDVRRSNIYQKISPRGLGVTGTKPEFSSRILGLMDGRRLNNAWAGAFRGDLPLTNVERIEVIRGPGSSLYGPNAFTGVINIITKSGKDVELGEVLLGAGGDSTYLGEANIGKKFDKADVFLSLRGFTTNGQDLLNNNNDDAEMFDLLGKVKFKDVVFSIGHDSTEKGIPGRIGSSTPDDRWKTKSDFADISYTNDITQKLNLGIKGYINKNTDDFYFKTAPTPDLKNESLSYGLNLQGNYQISDYHLFIIGSDFFRDQTEQIGKEEHSANNFGPFLEYSGRFFEKLFLTLGARYDVHSIYEDVFTPRVGAVYRVGEDTTIKASYGEAFRAPTFEELYVDFWRNSRQHMMGNENLKSERLKTYELGLVQRIWHNLQSNLSLFYTDAKDLIVTKSESLGQGKSKFYNDNIGDAEIKGFELGLKGKPFKFFSFFGNYSYQDGEDGSGNNLIYVPHNKFNLGINVHPLEYASFNLTVHYVGERDYETEKGQKGTLESYTVTDLKLQCSWKKVTIALAIYNLFNEIYEETKDYLTPERSYLVTLGYKF